VHKSAIPRAEDRALAGWVPRLTRWWSLIEPWWDSSWVYINPSHQPGPWHQSDGGFKFELDSGNACVAPGQRGEVITSPTCHDIKKS